MNSGNAIAEIEGSVPTLQRDARKATFLNVLQTGILRTLIEALFNEDSLDPVLLRQFGSEYSRQLLAGYDELLDWPDEQWADLDALQAFGERVTKAESPPPEPPPA